MATLTSDTARGYELGDREEYPVAATTIIFEGAAVGEDGNGYARPLAAGDAFLGFAEKKADNGAGATGDINVRVKTKGKIKAAIDSLEITANDRPVVFMSDDDTFILAAAGNSPIGCISRWTSTGFGIVEFDAAWAALVRAVLQYIS
jgi:hypothetical protein